MKLVTIVGARPQFIKSVVVSEELQKQGMREIIIHTGQHYDTNMSETFFQELELPKPDYYLGVGSGLHGEQTGKMLLQLEKILLKEKPDMVLVYGDTNSTLAGALSATKLHIPVAHIEAGLRSFNKKMPEEINRILTDHISTLLFAPSKTAVQNLEREGIVEGVYKVGDVMFDVTLKYLKQINLQKILKKFSLREKEFLLVTIHRAENTDNFENLKNILEAIFQIANYRISVIFPVHPRTFKAFQKLKIEKIQPIKKENWNKFVDFLTKGFPKEGVVQIGNLQFREPVSYFEMLGLEKGAKVILTDSGGVQKESYFVGTPAIVARNETEWIELVQIGFNQLIGPKRDKIVQSVLKMFQLGIPKEEISHKPFKRLNNLDKNLKNDNNQTPFDKSKSFIFQKKEITIKKEGGLITYNLGSHLGDSSDSKKNFYNIYGDGTTAFQIVSIINNYLKLG